MLSAARSIEPGHFETTSVLIDIVERTDANGNTVKFEYDAVWQQSLAIDENTAKREPLDQLAQRDLSASLDDLGAMKRSSRNSVTAMCRHP